MKKINTYIGLLLFTTLAMSCDKASNLNLEMDKEQILKMHNAQRDFHFNKDSIAFANQFNDNFISINKGLVTYPQKKETISRYHNYFSSVEFLEWDDVKEPIIRFSEDGSLAYTVVDKIVKVTYKNENGKTIEGETHFAWNAIYRKQNNEWRIECVTSTNKPIKANP